MPEQLRPRARPTRENRPPAAGPGRGEPGPWHRLPRLAVLPAALVALIATAVIAYLLEDGRRPHPDRGDGLLWAALGGAACLTATVLAVAAAVAAGQGRAHAARLAALRGQAAQGRADLQVLLGKVERGERIRPPDVPPQPVPEDDPLDRLRYEIATARHAAESAVFQAAALAGAGSGRDERVDVFVNLARRMQSFVHRQLEYLDELEAEVEDPDLLKGLFHLDHLATRVRRHAENLAVLGGAVSRRQWSRPVCVSEVLRSCVAEVEHYARVRLVPPIEGTVRGHAVADVVHLLAELVENATEFSAPQTQVLLRTQWVAAGLAVEVEDRGLGMTADEQSRMNAVLSGTERLDVTELLEAGRVGLFVVSALARRHDIVVQLQSNIYGGVQAVAVLPHELLGDETQGRRAPGTVLGVAAGSAPPGGGQKPRPPLPRRSRQEHLVPRAGEDAPPPV
ncbi:sensor histidine kinase, partial [Streptomyces sp. URMC 129]|uniref:sensor histidine kinase n=1 Tax=Streptomyces sp. URMC 129 TaxID=3423407 RepID=UPI003F19EA51